MKEVSVKEQQSVVGGAGHFHWYCGVNSYLSAKYGKRDDALVAGGGHIGRYPSHKNVVTFTGTKGCTQAY